MSYVQLQNQICSSSRYTFLDFQKYYQGHDLCVLNVLSFFLHFWQFRMWLASAKVWTFVGTGQY